PLIYGAYRALLDHGDTVVYTVPSWNNNHYVHLCGARGIAVRARSANGFQPTAESLAPQLREAKLLVINSPLNPAGTGFSRGQPRASAELWRPRRLARGRARERRAGARGDRAPRPRRRAALPDLRPDLLDARRG